MRVSPDEAVLALLASAVVGSLIGMGLSRLSGAARLAAAIDKAQGASDRAAAAEEAAKAAVAELTSARERLSSADVEAGRLQAEAARIPVLEGVVSALRGELARTQEASAAEQARAERIPNLDAALDRLQLQLKEAGDETARLQARADLVPGLKTTVTQQQARLDQLHAALAAADQEKSRLAIRVEEAAARSQDEQARLDQLQSALAVASQEKARLLTCIEEAAVRTQDQQARLDQLQAALAEADQEKARLVTRVEEAALRSLDQQALLERAQAISREGFPTLSAEILASSREVFLDAARTAMSEFEQRASAELGARQAAIEQLVSPVRDSVASLRAAMQALESSRFDVNQALGTEVATLEKAQEELRAATRKLTKALGPRNRQDRWGEVPLSRLVEMAGVGGQSHVDGSPGGSTAEGCLRPDVIVNLAGLRTAAIDSKAPLDAYFSSLEADDEADRKNLLRVHAANMRDYVTLLGGQTYRAQLPSSSDFVIMYVPLDSALAAAVEEDPGLIDYALGSSVIPATPLTLRAHLKTAAWMAGSLNRQELY